MADGSGVPPSSSSEPRAQHPRGWSATPKRTVVGKTPQERADELVAWLHEDRPTRPATLAEVLRRWARSTSLVPLVFGTGCCGADLDAALRLAGLPRPDAPAPHADLLLVTGAVTARQAPHLERLHVAMPAPTWVVAVGSCACAGPLHETYARSAPVDAVLPVDLYVPGCPPRPEAVLDGLLKLQTRIRSEPRARAVGADPIA